MKVEFKTLKEFLLWIIAGVEEECNVKSYEFVFFYIDSSKIWINFANTVKEAQNDDGEVLCVQGTFSNGGLQWLTLGGDVCLGLNVTVHQNINYETYYKIPNPFYKDERGVELETIDL